MVHVSLRFHQQSVLSTNGLSFPLAPSHENQPHTAECCCPTCIFAIVIMMGVGVIRHGHSSSLGATSPPPLHLLLPSLFENWFNAARCDRRQKERGDAAASFCNAVTDRGGVNHYFSNEWSMYMYILLTDMIKIRDQTHFCEQAVIYKE